MSRPLPEPSSPLRWYLELWELSPPCARAYTTCCLEGRPPAEVARELDVRKDYLWRLCSRAHLYLIARSRSISVEGGLERTAYRVIQAVPDRAARQSLAHDIDETLRHVVLSVPV
jgi:hypothetical protein